MNQKGIVLSGMIYALLVFFLLLLSSFLTVLWYRQSAINNLGKDANDIYDEVPIPFTTDFSYDEGVNVPRLATGMTPIKWNGSSWVATNESDTAWYDYENKIWANARTADGSMWVWIPRYAYQITSGYHTSTAGVISVKFLIDLTNTPADGTSVSTEPTYIADSQTNYITHPAFTFGNSQLTGIWVAKFEATASEGVATITGACNASDNVTSKTIKVIPNANSWRCISVGNIFDVALDMKNKGVYGWNTSEVNTHLIKNIEWGAVAYLGKSKYGKNAEIWINNSYEFITGCAGNNENDDFYDGCEYAYTTPNGQQASTTGNIYGIYDMSGGAYEYTSSYIDNGSVSLSTNGLSIINAENKYKDIYEVTTDDQATNYDNTIDKKGDAVYETSNSFSLYTAWYSDASSMMFADAPWLRRSGYAKSTSSAGLFCFGSLDGIAYSGTGFRPTLLVGDGL